LPHGGLTIPRNALSADQAIVASQQTILNGEVHNWYRIVLGYSDHLVNDLLDQFELRRGDAVIDAFCGSGTTLVECKKNGIDAVGIDANPSSCFSARVKTNWTLKSNRLVDLLSDVNKRQRLRLLSSTKYLTHPTYRYLESTGMLERGWISARPLRKAIAIKSSIESLPTSSSYKNALTLALIAEVVYGVSNVKFGPELYCVKKRRDADVYSGFQTRVLEMAADLDAVTSLRPGAVEVFQGDSRDCYQLLRPEISGRFSAAICSPPYPTEHDYTRNTRLELAFLGLVSDRKTLRAIKEDMIRSHTKNIYKDDNDAARVRRVFSVKKIVHKLERKTKNINHGFGRLYPTVISEYFGGMRRHFESMARLLKSKAFCAYVVGDQASYMQVHIPTAEILSSLAEKSGFRLVEIKHWRTRWSSSTSREVDENILILQKRK
jgi:SAM-dependent methyltransferase